MTVSLAEALSKKMISAEISAPSGASNLLLKLENAGAKTVHVEIEQGQLFEPSDAAAQNLVAAEAQTLAVQPRKPLEILLKTFCTEASDMSPTGEMRFALGSLAAENVRKMLAELQKLGKLNDDSAQGAVWSACEGSGFHVAGIQNETVRRAACQTLNRPEPTYKIRYQTTDVPGERAFLGRALVVDGNYRYFLARDERLTMALFDASGKSVKVLFRDRPSAKGEHRSGLHLELQGLKQGKYFLRLTTKSGEIVEEQEVEF